MPYLELLGGDRNDADFLDSIGSKHHGFIAEPVAEN
jgi:hypothetical protein